MQLRSLGSIVAAACAAAFPAVASAHISLEQAGTHMSRYGDDEIKDAPCGRANGTRGTNVYTYAPGETIMVSVVEFVPHPGYFRIAFDDDGDDDFLDPQSIDPISRSCMGTAADHCGEADFYNNDTVLEGMDNLDPHMAGGTKTYTWEVTLPNVECDNCTLQIIQVMEDAVHGPYNPAGSGVSEAFYIEDIYHTCIDLVLTGEGGSAGAGGAGAGGASGAGAGGAGAGAGGVTGSAGSIAPSGGSGGAGTAGAAGGAAGSTSPPAAGAGGDTGSMTGGVTGTPAGMAGSGALPGVTPPAQDNSSSSSSGCVAAPGSRTHGAAAIALLLLPFIARRPRRRAG